MLLDLLFFVSLGSFVWGFQASGGWEGSMGIYCGWPWGSWLLYEKMFLCFSLAVSDARPDAGEKGRHEVGEELVY